MAKLVPFGNQHAFLRTARIIGQKHDMKVCFDRDVQGELEIEGDTVKIKPMPAAVSQAKLDSMLATIDYVGSLYRYGDKEQATNLAELPADQPIGWMYRLFNDERITRNAAEEYAGSRRWMSNRTEDGLAGITKGFDELDPKQQAVIAATLDASSDWNAGASHASLPVTPDAQAMLAKLHADGVPGMLRNQAGGTDPLALAKHVYRMLWEDDPDEQEQKEREGKGEGEDKVNPKGNPFNNGHSEMVHAKPEGKEEGETEMPASGYGDDESPTPDKPELPRPALKNPRKPDTSGAARMEPPANIRVYSPEQAREAAGLAGSRKDTYANALKAWAGKDAGSAVHAAVFANKIRRFIQARAAVTYEHGHKRGTLSSKNVYRVALPREAQTRASERIFKRKVESDTLDTCVNVMVDMSGSMSGEATGHTYIATTLLSNALYVLGVPCEINAFSTGANPLSSTGRSTVIYRLKDWSERVTSEEMFDRYLSVIGCGMANNNDSAALMYAYDRLTQRPETRKILVMQSDGQPACRDVDSDNSKQCLIDAAKAVERSGQVDLLALGVGSEGICSVQGFYSRWAGVHGSAELEEKLFDLVAKRMVNAS